MLLTGGVHCTEVPISFVVIGNEQDSWGLAGQCIYPQQQKPCISPSSLLLYIITITIQQFQFPPQIPTPLIYSLPC